MRIRVGGRRDNRTEDEQDNLNDVPMQWFRMFSYLGGYKLRLLVALISLFIGGVISLIFPQVIGQVVDSVFVSGDMAMLDGITLALVAVFFLRALTTLIESYNLTYIGESIVNDVRKEIFQRVQMLSLGFFTSRRVGELLSRISSDVTVMRTALTYNIGTLLQQSIILVGSIVLMVTLNWRLTGFLLLLIPVIFVSAIVVGRVVQRYSTRVQDEIAASTVIAEEALQNIKEVKSFVREPYEVNRYNGAITRAFRSSIVVARFQSAFGSLMAFLGFGSLALFLWFGGREVLEGRLTAGVLITFLFYGISVAGSAAGLVSLYTQFRQAMGSSKRVFQLIDEVPDLQDAANAQALGYADGRVTFESVSFAYDGVNDVLHDISLDVAPGEVVALVGPSGAGKSTMFNLIPRFYDPKTGAVKIDGHDLRSLTQASVRAQIGIVPQESLLFGGTIRENILYGRLDASEDEMIAAARAANAHDFIMGLPAQYETLVGERGVRLSGGQRQRVAIARAVLKDPRILLLDEATSSLDSESESLVQDALARLMENRTTLIIAHRLSTIRVADRIVVINAGRIAEIGTHDELMARGEIYARLYEMQFRDETSATVS